MNKKIVTGVFIADQLSKAQNILNNQVLPKEELFQIRSKNNCLSKELKEALKQNA